MLNLTKKKKQKQSKNKNKTKTKTKTNSKNKKQVNFFTKNESMEIYHVCGTWIILFSVIKQCLKLWWNKIVNIYVNTAIMIIRRVNSFLVLITNFSLNLNKRWTYYLFGFLKIHSTVHHPFELHLDCSWSWVRSSKCSSSIFRLPIRALIVLSFPSRNIAILTHTLSLNWDSSPHWLLISQTLNLPCFHPVSTSTWQNVPPEVKDYNTEIELV